MRKLAITEWGAPLQMIDAPTPQPQGAQVVVKTQACGVCHSDVHVWDGYFDLGAKGRMRFADRGATLPFTLGHEIVGTVVAKGPDARGVDIGKSYVVYPWIGCGQCASCRADDELMCMNMRSLGIRCDGGYADHVVVPDAKYCVAYDGVPMALAATYACSGITAWGALKKAMPLKADDWLCIVGAGGVGGSAVSMARLQTKAKLVVVDIDPAKLDAAKKAGADAVINSREPEALQKLLALTGGGAAAVVDFVGSGDTMTFDMDAARRGGCVVIVGLYGGSLTISPLQIATKVLRILGSFVGTLDDLKDVIALAQQGKLAPIPVHTRPWSEGTQALEDLKAGGRVVGRVALMFS